MRRLAVEPHADARSLTAARMNSTASCVGAPGVNTSATPVRLELGDVVGGIVPPTVTTTSSTPCSREQLHDPRHERHVGAGQDRQPDRVGVLLDHRLDDLLGRLVQAGVDHLHAGVAQRAGDDLRAAVVPVEAGLRDDDADLLLWQTRAWYVARAGRRRARVSRTRATRGRCPTPAGASRTISPSVTSRAGRLEQRAASGSRPVARGALERARARASAALGVAAARARLARGSTCSALERGVDPQDRRSRRRRPRCTR